MANTKKEEARALDNEERDLVEKSHHPALQDLSDQDLSQLVKLTRERRDKAKTQANQRRREIPSLNSAAACGNSRSNETYKSRISSWDSTAGHCGAVDPFAIDDMLSNSGWDEFQ